MRRCSENRPLPTETGTEGSLNRPEGPTPAAVNGLRDPGDAARQDPPGAGTALQTCSCPTTGTSVSPSGSRGRRHGWGEQLAYGW